MSYYQLVTDFDCFKTNRLLEAWKRSRSKLAGIGFLFMERPGLTNVEDELEHCPGALIIRPSLHLHGCQLCFSQYQQRPVTSTNAFHCVADLILVHEPVCRPFG